MVSLTTVESIHTNSLDRFESAHMNGLVVMVALKHFARMRRSLRLLEWFFMRRKRPIRMRFGPNYCEMAMSFSAMNIDPIIRLLSGCLHNFLN